MPDAVLMQSVQRGLLSLRRGLLVHVLEAFPGTHPPLGALLGHIQLPTESDRAFARVVDEEHRVAVVALKDIRECNRRAFQPRRESGAAQRQGELYSLLPPDCSL